MIAYTLLAVQLALLSLFCFFAFYNYLYGFASLFKPKLARVDKISGKRVAVVIVSFNEKYVIEDTVKACERLSYPNKVVIVADDSRDKDTLSLLRKMALERGCKKTEDHSYDYRYVEEGKLKREPIELWESRDFVLLHRDSNHGFKAGGLKGVEQYLEKNGIEYMYLLDADWVPQEDIIEKSLEVLEASDSLAFVVTKSRTVERPLKLLQHYISLNQESCYYVDFAGRQAVGDPILFPGCCTLFRVSALKQAGGFTPGQLTEDIELSNRLWLLGWKSVYIEDLENHGEVPPSYETYRRQQEHWAAGSARVLKNYFWKILKSRRLGLREKLAIIRQDSYYFTPLFTEASIAVAAFTLAWLMFSSNLFEKELYMFLVTRYALPLSVIVFLALASNFVPLVLTAVKKRSFHELFYIPNSLWYSWSLLHSYLQGNLKGLFNKKMNWFLTPKTNGKRKYKDKPSRAALVMKLVNGLSLAVFILFYVYEARMLGWLDVFVLFWVPAFVVATLK